LKQCIGGKSPAKTGPFSCWVHTETSDVDPRHILLRIFTAGKIINVSQCDEELKLKLFAPGVKPHYNALSGLRKGYKEKSRALITLSEVHK